MRKATVIPALIIAASVIAGCENEKHSYVANVKDPAKTPTMVTRDVSTLISDSGYTRYHIETPVWNMFEDTLNPHWTFPRGLDLEQYDRDMKPAAFMRCDSATYFTRQRLWRLDGDVVMVNTLRDTFLTQQVFWNQMRAEVYSDSFVHIVRSSHIIEGYGFTSNQDMTSYTLNRPTAIIPLADRNKQNTQAAMPPSDDYTEPLNRADRPMAPEPASQRARNRFLITPATNP